MKGEFLGKRRGQSTLELVIALAILAMSISASVAVFFGGRALLLDAQFAAEAEHQNRALLENARLQAESDFGGLASASSTYKEFLWETFVEIVDAETKKVTARVSWQTDPARRQDVQLVTILTNWRAVAVLGGDTGGGGLSGNWQNPRTLGSIDLGPGNSATGLDVQDKIVYLSAKASAASKPDFFIIDATNGESPVVASSINTGEGLNAVDVAGGHAYVGNRATDAQLQIIDVSNKSAPSLVRSFQLPGVSGSGAVGQSVFYYGSKVYVGTKKATGPEFHVIDVSDPANPVALGSREINADVNAIRVVGATAYLATSDDEELKVYDMDDPANITKIGGYDAPGDSEDGQSVHLAGTSAYLGRTVGGNHDDHHELHLLDASSPTSLQDLGSKDIAADVNGIQVRDQLAFLGTSDPNKEFQVWNIGNPQNITLWASFNFPQVATGVDYEDNLVYISVRSNDALRIVTSSP